MARFFIDRPIFAWVLAIVVMLAGGLSPDNIVAAVRATGARQVDVNSGVESAPGAKDHATLRALFAALQTLAAA